MSLEQILRKGLHIVPKHEELERLENLLQTLEDGEIEVAKEWLKSAIRLLREQEK